MIRFYALSCIRIKHKASNEAFQAHTTKLTLTLLPTKALAIGLDPLIKHTSWVYQGMMNTILNPCFGIWIRMGNSLHGAMILLVLENTFVGIPTKSMPALMTLLLIKSSH